MTSTPEPDLHAGMISSFRAVYAGGGPTEGLRIPFSCSEENDCGVSGEAVLIIGIAATVSMT